MKRILIFTFLSFSPMLSSADGGTFNPIKLGTFINYPFELATVEAASKFVLEPTGYRLVTYSDLITAPEESRSLATKPIPAKARVKRYLTIEQALWLLIGEKNQLVVDHEHKLVSFESIVSADE